MKYQFGWLSCGLDDEKGLDNSGMPWQKYGRSTKHRHPNLPTRAEAQ